ncbi:MAG: hypothetical protein EXX96DRAFT_607059 [Benjaminiella poitrasii]|nr:MAG: hypothetical protein EXX96DRAFT_607059 [Benjaminiella poitrasii]
MHKKNAVIKYLTNEEDRTICGASTRPNKNITSHFDKRHNELLSIEASSGLEKEDMEHTMENMLKYISSTIAFNNGIDQKHLDASFSTFKKVKIFCIQSINQTIILFSTFDDITKVGHYCHIEHRKTEIPCNKAAYNIDDIKQNGEIYVEPKDTMRFNLLL